MEVLLYGFKPYKEWKTNISEKIVRKIKRKNLKKIVFDVKPNKKQFIAAINKAKPDIIIGLAQSPRAKKIKIERKALNAYARTKKQKPRRILKAAKKTLPVNLKIKKDKNSRISYDAGTYVCNYSMYVILKHIKNKNIKFAFFHIPMDYNLNKALKFVNKVLRPLH